MSGHSPPGTRKGRGSCQCHRDTPSPDPTIVASHSSPSISTHTVPYTPFFPKSTHPQAFIPMTQFSQPFGVMPYSMGYTLITPTTHPPEPTP